MKRVAIIGAGPAGSTLATYLKRYNIDTIVFENGKTNLSLAKEIENYYGIASISGQELYDRGLEKLASLGVSVVKEEVVSISGGEPFLIKTAQKSFEADILVLASGLAKKGLNVKGLSLFEGHGISYCATCDSFFFRKKKLGIVGASAYMEEELRVLERITTDITIFSDGIPYQNDKHLVVSDKITEFYGDTSLKGLKTVKDSYDLDGLFIANGNYGSFAITKHLGINTNESGEVVVDSEFKTNYPNCYAIGDIIPGIKQIHKACNDGMTLAYILFRKLTVKP